VKRNLFEGEKIEMKVLFIGNSYTYFNGMPKLFENLSRENGKARFPPFL